jgi:hypothetical protein
MAASSETPMRTIAATTRRLPGRLQQSQRCMLTFGVTSLTSLGFSRTPAYSRSDTSAESECLEAMPTTRTR